MQTIMNLPSAAAPALIQEKVDPLVAKSADQAQLVAPPVMGVIVQAGAEVNIPALMLREYAPVPDLVIWFTQLPDCDVIVHGVVEQLLPATVTRSTRSFLLFDIT